MQEKFIVVRPHGAREGGGVKYACNYMFSTNLNDMSVCRIARLIHHVHHIKTLLNLCRERQFDLKVTISVQANYKGEQS